MGVGWREEGVILKSGLSHMRVAAGDCRAGLGTGGQDCSTPTCLLSREPSNSPPGSPTDLVQGLVCTRPAWASDRLKPLVGTGQQSGSTPALASSVLQPEPGLPHPAATRLHPPVFLSLRVTP